MKFLVVFEKTNTGYSAYSPDVPGCIAAGGTLEETEKLMREALEGHLEWMRRDNDEMPKPVSRVAFFEYDAAAGGGVRQQRAVAG